MSSTGCTSLASVWRFSRGKLRGGTVRNIILFLKKFQNKVFYGFEEGLHKSKSSATFFRPVGTKLILGGLRALMSILFGCCCCARTKKILKSAVSVNFENALTQIIGGGCSPPSPPDSDGPGLSQKSTKNMYLSRLRVEYGLDYFMGIFVDYF